MKTVLRGINLMDYLSFKTLISKTVGVVFSPSCSQLYCVKQTIFCLLFMYIMYNVVCTTLSRFQTSREYMVYVHVGSVQISMSDTFMYTDLGDVCVSVVL